jgi:hypothetical protein
MSQLKSPQIHSAANPNIVDTLVNEILKTNAIPNNNPMKKQKIPATQVKQGLTKWNSLKTTLIMRNN